MTSAPTPKIIDYENSRYRTDFWIGQGREYEDRVERLALRRLLPNAGQTLIDIGAGFGRLASLYDSYQTVVLADYSLSLLKEAYEQYHHDERFLFVAANVYDLPFASDAIDTIVMIRVMHHLEQPLLAIKEIARVLKPEQHFVFEYANKRNLKAILRYGFRRQSWNPYSLEPYEFVPLNYDFHPTWMHQQFQQAGLDIEKEFAVSHFRLPGLKNLIPPHILARLDALLFSPGAKLKLSPSVMGRATKTLQAKSSPTPQTPQSASPENLLRCLKCHHPGLNLTTQAICPRCHQEYPIIDGIIDLRTIPS